MNLLGEMNSNAALAKLCNHLANLGLRLPSEKTCSKVTALMIWKVHHTMDASQKHQAYVHVKAQMRKHLEFSNSRNMDLPYILELPEEMTEMDTSWMKLAFCHEARCDIPIDASILHMLHASIAERVGPSMNPIAPSMGSSMAFSSQYFVGSRPLSNGEGMLSNLQIFGGQRASSTTRALDRANSSLTAPSIS